MVRKLIILIITLHLNFLTFSQNDTSKVCLSYEVARLVAIDLVKGDSAIAELEQTHIWIFQLDKKIIEKDSIISLYIDKDINNKTIIENGSLKESKYKEVVEGLEKDNSKLISKNKSLKTTIKFMGGGIVGLIAIIAINTITK